MREEIVKFDTARAHAMRSLFNVEEEDSRLYHLVLNTERLPHDACVKAVCELAEGSHFGDRVSTRSAPADKLLEAIAAARRIKAKSFTIDGEAVVLGPDGLSLFDERRRREAAHTALIYRSDRT